MRKNKLHPAVQLVYFLLVMGLLIKINHPIFIVISYISGFCISVAKKGARALVFNIIATLCAITYIFIYSGYNHFGVTVLRENFIGNSITLEAIAKGAAISFTAVALVFWAECFHLVFTSDKIGFLVGKISKSAKQLLMISLRAIPQASEKSRQIHKARKGIGKGFSRGNIISNIKELKSFVSINIDCFIQAIFEKSISMKSRGFALKRKTNYSKYSFSNKDRLLLVGMILITVIILVGFYLGQMSFDFSPIITFSPITIKSFISFAAFAALCGTAVFVL